MTDKKRLNLGSYRFLIALAIMLNLLLSVIAPYTVQAVESDYAPDMNAISIHLSEAELRVAQTLHLNVMFDPDDVVNKKVTWSSSDEAVATVNENGIVVALKQGQAMITATAEENGLQAYSQITVNPLLGNPSKPTIAGYGYVHPLSWANMKMTMKVESQVNGAQLIMVIPNNKALLLDFVSDVKVKLKEGHKTKTVGGTSYSVENNTITINLGHLTGANKVPNIYTIAVYVKMKPAATLNNISKYNHGIDSAKGKITVSNKLYAFIDIGGSSEPINFDLESYELELIKIPNIN
ncbi:MAG TPA: Ig-like domain-containing protein [Epulopiscium sp.]|nr:Ig-like domain-containing protein [Candidatus Epulonipiscium sp.]